MYEKVNLEYGSAVRQRLTGVASQLADDEKAARDSLSKEQAAALDLNLVKTKNLALESAGYDPPTPRHFSDQDRGAVDSSDLVKSR